MSPTGPSTPTPGTAPACPSAAELEVFVSDGAPGTVVAHVAACAACRLSAEAIRENMRFMRDFLGTVGPRAAEPSRTTAPAAPSPDLLPGYVIEREIARGGQGVVYEATQIETKRRVAIKMLEPGPKNSRGRRRIEREAEISAGLRHPNIVTIYASAPLPDGRYALAMEYLDGLTLDEWARKIDEQTPPERGAQRESVRKKLRAFAAVCDAVQFAHQNGVIHRDLKPGNVVVDEAGVPRVVDFGIARRLAPEPGITRAGEFAGTLAYASPEQVSGDQDSVDTRSDVYSLGVMLYEVLTGRRPYKTEESLTGAIANITRAEPRPMGKVEPGGQPAGDDLETVVCTALAKDRGHRYQTAGALRDDIENFLAGDAIDAKRDSRMYMLRKSIARNRAAVAVVAGFVVVLVVFAVSMAWSARKLDRQRGLLAQSLASSTVERGRLLGASGSAARAEELIWPELIHAGVDVRDPGLGFRSSPEATQAAWALFELYSRHPSMLHVPVLAGADLLTFEEGGKTVRISRSDGAEELRRVPDGKFLRSFAASLPEGTRRVAAIPLGRFSTALDPQGVVVMDSRTKARKILSDPLLKKVVWADVNADGSRLLTIDNENTLGLWQVEPVKQVATLCERLESQCRPYLSVDGQLAVGVIRNQVKVWQTSDAAEVWSWTIPQNLWDNPALRTSLKVATISPDRRRVAAGFISFIVVFSTEHPDRPPIQISAHRGWINFVGFSADSSLLLSSGSERDYLAWNPENGELLSVMSTSSGLRGIPSLSADGSLAGVCDAGDLVRIWQTRPRRWLSKLTDPTDTVFCVRFSPDGQRVAATCADGGLRVWKTDGHELVWSSPKGGSPLVAACYTPDGARIVTLSQGGGVAVWNAGGEGGPARIAQVPVSSTWIGCTHDGRRVAVAASDSKVYFYDLATGALVLTLSGHTGRLAEATFSPEGSMLASVGVDGVCTLWDAASGAVVRRLEGHKGPVRAVCFSPDGRTIATGGDDWTIRIWDVATGRCSHLIKDVKQHVFGLAFHPDGNILFSCCRDPVVQAWDARTGRELAALDGHDGLVLSMAVSPDGKTLLTGSADRTVGLWELGYYQTHVRGNEPAWRNTPAPAPESP